ncbi:MAG: hypothetical protein JWL61_4758, partial [Gemmatimonadetes bacterium]|nr:hypothetical protein [Gemmatimonadota bacterium]
MEREDAMKAEWVGQHPDEGSIH